VAERITELATIRTTMPLEGPDVFDDARIHQLPVGSEGTVMHIFDDGEAFEVEFLVWPDGPKQYRSVQIPVEVDQCELAWKAPA